MEFSNYIKSLVDSNSSNSVALILRNKTEVRDWINSKTAQFSPKHLMESVYIILHGPPPQCKYGNKLQFNTFDKGYRKGCVLGNKCRCVDIHRVANQKTTLLEKYGVSSINEIPGVLAKRKHTMMDRYGVEHAAQSELVKEKLKLARNSRTTEQVNKINEKTKQTNLAKFGVEHHMQSQVQREKVYATNTIKYGTKVPMQNELIKASAATTVSNHSDKVKQDKVEKQRKTFTTRYGVNAASKIQLSTLAKTVLESKQSLSEFITNKTRDQVLMELGIHAHTLYLHIKKYSLHALLVKPPRSKFEKEVLDWLSELNIKVETNNRTILRGKELDIFLPEYNVGIECNGLYWHSENSSGRDKNYHFQKHKLAQDAGVILISIFSDNWDNKKEIVKARILHKLNRAPITVYARHCSVTMISKDTANTFIEAHHVQGKSPSSINYGLYFNTELVSVMTFGRPRFNKKYEYELVRYCSSVRVIGGASKLFRSFVNEHVPSSIVSYSESAWGSGGLYEKLGFIFKDEAVGYQYTNYKNRFNRIKFQKHKIANLVENGQSLTEWEIMQELGYDRVWDCGQKTWTYESK